MQKVYSQILQIAGDVITVEADDVAYKELAEIKTSLGTSLAQVIRLEGNKVSLQVLAGSRGISTNDKVRFLKKQIQVSFSENLVGRIFDGAGNPRDNGPDLTDNMIDIGGPSVNPSKRVIPTNMIRTGIPMIDVLTRSLNHKSYRFSLLLASRTMICSRVSPCRPKLILLFSAGWV